MLGLRGLPDGKDINRSFPGAKGGSLARLLAYTLMHELVPLADLGIDFQLEGQVAPIFPKSDVRFTLKKPANSQRNLRPRHFLHSTLIKKSFTHAVPKKGAPILVYETGESLRLDEEDIDIGIEGTLQVM